ncbi:SMI1/KNR4 family protein [Streptomyces sp. bgisy153]|uniref:SMI1/KNR4 family protein n=1 Tax=Streptomyces sp. bgisy153 TaxID=3413793 RepID=UPI003D75A1EB
MSGEAFDWHEFLGRWQREWVPRDHQEGEAPEKTYTSAPGGPNPRPLGSPGAPEAAIAASEERLGRRLPPSYREFLAVSDGWQVDETAGVYRLGGVADIDWFHDPHGLTPLYQGDLGDNPSAEEVLLAGMWQRALRLETDSDMSYALLDPGDRDPDGEWALYVYKGWSGELPDRYPSFRAYMEARYRAFHADRAHRPDFVNATTRAQDARVAQARLLVLRGRYEEARPLLEEARAFGRPGSAALLNQLRQLMAPHSPRDQGFLVGDPRYLTELLPLQVLTLAHGGGRRGGDDHWLGMMAARGVARETARAALDAVRDSTHRYAPAGTWGRAVAEARETARWGDCDAAWRVLRAALALWEAPGPDVIAPVGLLADPVLGPLITPERGREILATPRSGQRGPAPEQVPDLDPPGLAWLTEPIAGRRPFDGYRCVWTEATDPTRLPDLLGEEDARLSGPTDLRRAFWRGTDPHRREDAEPWADRATVAVGRTARGWAFAFDGWSHRHLNKLFRSPAAAASADGRAVVVWCDPGPSAPGRHGVFHLSVAERGEELYAFTARGTDIQRSGSIPPPLDPARLFRPQDTDPDRELRLLHALHGELGLSLPRFALTKGSLHTFTTRSWTRPPRDGESFAWMSFVRHRL